MRPDVGAAGGPRIAIASYADAVRDIFLGGDTLSYGTKAEILAAVGPWLQVEKDDYANPDTDSTTRNLEKAYTAAQTLFTSTPRAGDGRSRNASIHASRCACRNG